MEAGGWHLPCWTFLFWTGHSMRHVLPTISAVFGESKERRNYLGRWSVNAQQSSDYVHTCRQIVHDVQGLVCDKLSGGAPGYDEEELFSQLAAWLKDSFKTSSGSLQGTGLLGSESDLAAVSGCWHWPST